MRRLLKGFRYWREDRKPVDVVSMYEQGFAGAYEDDDDRESFRDAVTEAGGNVSGEFNATAYRFAGSAEGGLHLPFVHAVDALGFNPFPGAAQEIGDCVAHGTIKAGIVTTGCEIASAKPDEVSGKLERAPDVSPKGMIEGGFATAPLWWIRRAEQGGGSGWSCSAGARAMMKTIGLWPMNAFPELNIDLSDYSHEKITQFGTRMPPQVILTEGRKHLMRNATEPESWQVAADFIARGSGINSCGGQAWSSTRDANGYSPTTRGGWAHSESYIACDWRPWVQGAYGCPALFAQQNSWGVWNKGPRDIYDSAKYVPHAKRDKWIKLDLVNPETGNLMIPKGCRWVDCRTLDSRYLIAFSGQSGWPVLKMPDYGFSVLG